MTDVSPTPAPSAPLPPPAPSSTTPVVAGRVLDLVDAVVNRGRSATLAIERAASVTRKLPALLFGLTLALAGITFLVLAGLRGSVEVTGAIWPEPKPWVAWLALGIIIFVVAFVVGTLRNHGRKTT